MKSLMLFLLFFGAVLSGKSQTLWFTNASDLNLSLTLDLQNSATGFGDNQVEIATAVPVEPWAVYSQGFSWGNDNWLELSMSAPGVVDDFGIGYLSGASQYLVSENIAGQSQSVQAIPEPSEFALLLLFAFGVAGCFHLHRIQQKKHMTKKSLTVSVRKTVDAMAPIGRACARTWVRLTLLFMLAFLLLLMPQVMHAQSNFPDTSTLITGPQTSFNTALTWVIGATGVLIVIAWIMKAMKRR